MNIFLPKNRLSTAYSKLSLFFLAGPATGAGNWQTEMARELTQANIQPCVIAIPIPLKYFEGDPDDVVATSKRRFKRQLPWERHYLEEAAETRASGCIVFWLAEESKTKPRTDGKPYAMDTRGELGEWRGRLMHNKKLRVVIGAEPNFPGLDIIHRNFELALKRRFTIYSSMKATARAAIRLARR